MWPLLASKQLDQFAASLIGAWCRPGVRLPAVRDRWPFILIDLHTRPAPSNPGMSNNQRIAVLEHVFEYSPK